MEVQTETPEAKATRRPFLRGPVAGLAAGTMLGAAAVGGMLALGDHLPTTSAAPVLYDEGRVVEMYQAANPATVEITVNVRSGFGRITETGQGSGFVIDSDGDILTNNHVVSGATTAIVTFSDKRTATAQIVATSPQDDLALLRVGPAAVKGITPLSLGDSSLVRPGQMAIALGSPYGYENSITVGVISGTNRTIRSTSGSPIPGALQTDASINPGNSGGPLLNSSGQVVGINTAIEASANGSTGVGFAVSINTAKAFLEKAKSGLPIVSSRPWLGITGAPLTPDIAQYLGLDATQGVYLIAVTPGSPAANAGLQGSSARSGAGDVVTAITGAPLSSVDDLIAQVAKHKPGDTVTLTVLRGGRSIEVAVTLGTWPDS